MPLDRVQPLKLESPDTGGDETDPYPSGCNRNEDYLDCHGVTLQSTTSNDDAVFIDRTAAGNIRFKDAYYNTTVLLKDLAGGGLTPTAHEILDQLVHNLAETCYEENTFVSGKLTNAITWDGPSKLKKIRENQYTYSGGKVSQEVLLQYNESGSEVERMTGVYTWAGNQLESITWTRT